jgi:uncharacterized damage-inducible protein DinB
MLVGYLSWQRHELLNICAGLDAKQLARRALPPSRLSLLGLIRHLAKVERVWFRQRAGQEQVAALYGGPGDPSDFEDVDAADAEGTVLALQMEWTHSDSAVANMPLSQNFEWRDETWSLRMAYLHVIGEYARHNGHADLLREAIDGVTGR